VEGEGAESGYINDRGPETTRDSLALLGLKKRLPQDHVKDSKGPEKKGKKARDETRKIR